MMFTSKMKYGKPYRAAVQLPIGLSAACFSLPLLDALYRTGIFGHLYIGRQQCYALDNGLRDEQAIEGIFMDWR